MHHAIVFNYFESHHLVQYTSGTQYIVRYVTIPQNLYKKIQSQRAHRKTNRFSKFRWKTTYHYAKRAK